MDVIFEESDEVTGVDVVILSELELELETMLELEVADEASDNEVSDEEPEEINALEEVRIPGLVAEPVALFAIELVPELKSALVREVVAELEFELMTELVAELKTELAKELGLDTLESDTVALLVELEDKELTPAFELVEDGELLVAFPETLLMIAEMAAEEVGASDELEVI